MFRQKFQKKRYKKAPILKDTSNPDATINQKDYLTLKIDTENIRDNGIFLIANYLPKFILIISVLIIIFSFAIPAIYKGALSQEVQGEHISLAETSNYVATPENGYFNKLFAEKMKTQKEPDTESLNYEGTFEISIPSIDINSTVKANVNPDEKSYTKVLDQENMLAHYKGNAIPGNTGNVFIYGHSTYEYLFNANSKETRTAFTKLFKLNLGEKIYITRDGAKYTYTITKIFQVDPTRLDILDQENQDEKLLTLMTCGAPPGDSSRRFIVIAKQDE
jgi:LPXTG-site transpeptidase (sortase) family protein